MYDDNLKSTINKLFSNITQRFNLVGEILSEQYNQLMADINKLNKAIIRKSIKPDNFVKRANVIIDKYNALELAFCSDPDRMKLVQPYREELKKTSEIKETQPVDEMKKEVEIKVDIVNKKRGGTRKGAGRKSLGIKKPVSITLPQEDWDEIDNLIKEAKFKSYADYFRSLRLKDSEVSEG